MRYEYVRGVGDLKWVPLGGYGVRLELGSSEAVLIRYISLCSSYFVTSLARLGQIPKLESR